MAYKGGIGNPPKKGTQAQSALPKFEKRYLDKQNMCVCVVILLRDTKKTKGGLAWECS